MSSRHDLSCQTYLGRKSMMTYLILGLFLLPIIAGFFGIIFGMISNRKKQPQDGNEPRSPISKP
jgi:hypothetical protein